MLVAMLFNPDKILLLEVVIFELSPNATFCVPPFILLLAPDDKLFNAFPLTSLLLPNSIEPLASLTLLSLPTVIECSTLIALLLIPKTTLSFTVCK